MSMREAIEAAPPVSRHAVHRHDSRLCGIQMNVMRDLSQGISRLDVQRLVTPLKRPPNLPAKTIGSLSPGSLEPLHSFTEVWFGCLDGQVKVVRHDRKGMNRPPEADTRLI